MAEFVFAQSMAVSPWTGQPYPTRFAMPARGMTVGFDSLILQRSAVSLMPLINFDKVQEFTFGQNILRPMKNKNSNEVVGRPLEQFIIENYGDNYIRDQAILNDIKNRNSDLHAQLTDGLSFENSVKLDAHGKVQVPLAKIDAEAFANNIAASRWTNATEGEPHINNSQYMQSGALLIPRKSAPALNSDSANDWTLVNNRWNRLSWEAKKSVFRLSMLSAKMQVKVLLVGEVLLEISDAMDPNSFNILEKFGKDVPEKFKELQISYDFNRSTAWPDFFATGLEVKLARPANRIDTALDSIYLFGAATNRLNFLASPGQVGQRTDGDFHLHIGYNQKRRPEAIDDVLAGWNFLAAFTDIVDGELDWVAPAIDHASPVAGIEGRVSESYRWNIDIQQKGFVRLIHSDHFEIRYPLYDPQFTLHTWNYLLSLNNREALSHIFFQMFPKIDLSHMMEMARRSPEGFFELLDLAKRNHLPLPFPDRWQQKFEARYTQYIYDRLNAQLQQKLTAENQSLNYGMFALFSDEGENLFIEKMRPLFEKMSHEELGKHGLAIIFSGSGRIISKLPRNLRLVILNTLFRSPEQGIEFEGAYNFSRQPVLLPLFDENFSLFLNYFETNNYSQLSEKAKAVFADNLFKYLVESTTPSTYSSNLIKLRQLNDDVMARVLWHSMYLSEKSQRDLLNKSLLGRDKQAFKKILINAIGQYVVEFQDELSNLSYHLNRWFDIYLSQNAEMQIAFYEVLVEFYPKVYQEYSEFLNKYDGDRSIELRTGYKQAKRSNFQETRLINEAAELVELFGLFSTGQSCAEIFEDKK